MAEAACEEGLCITVVTSDDCVARAAAAMIIDRASSV
jgi:hypothetical protein